MSLPALGHGTTFNLREDLELAAELPENSFRLLLRAARYAQSTHQPAKDFAVTLGELQASGLAECDLRWLARKGFVAQSPPISAGNGAALQSFNERSFFLLTPRGQQFVECLLADSAAGAGSLAAAPTGQHLDAAAGAVPCWDLPRRVLSLGQVVVKRFCVPAENQEIILSSFQEEAWPEHLDDPLPPADGIDAKRRLHSTIQRLNRNQKAPLLRFHGDGYGRGIRWEPRLAGQSKNP